MQKNTKLISRLCICAVGIFLYAAGVSITKNCNLGISPIVNTAYILSQITPITMGWCTTIVNILFFALQKILLKDKYPIWMIGAQFLMSILFSLAIDGTAIVFGFMTRLELAYFTRIIVFMIGCVVLGCGVFFIVLADFIVLPAEGCVNAIVSNCPLKLGTVKILFDASMVAITSILSFIVFKQIYGIREGTLIAVFLVGFSARTVGKYLGPKLAPLVKKEDA